MASPNQFNIEKLNRNNFARWVKDVKYLLMDRNCYNIVTEKEIKPTLKDEKDKTEQALIKDWEARERTAMSIIYLNIDPSLRSIVENFDNAVTAWKALMKHFRPDNRCRQMACFSEFLSCRMSSEENIDLFAARLSRITDELNGFSQTIPEVYKCFQLLCYLPTEFDMIVQGILQWIEQEFMFERITFPK